MGLESERVHCADLRYDWLFGKDIRWGMAILEETLMIVPYRRRLNMTPHL